MTGDYWRVAVVEDHLLQRRATVALVERQQGLRVVHDGETLPEFLLWLHGAGASLRPHLLVLDLVVDRGPSVDAEVVRRLVSDGIRVVVVSALSSPPLLRQVIRAGVGAVVDKRDSEEDLIAALRAVIGRERWMTQQLDHILGVPHERPVLSDQEERALVLYASGQTLNAVASALGVGRETAKTYVNRVKAKYALAGRPVRTKVELAHMAVVDGYLQR